jgi:lipopolysaccharide exporter
VNNTQLILPTVEPPGRQSTENLRGKMKRGAAWMVSFKLLDRGLGLISMLILARLLLPKDFGLVAMATSLIALLEMFSSFGLDTALIWHRDPTRGHFDSAWTLNLLAGCSIAVLMLALSWPASRYYHQPQLTLVICVLAVGAVIQGCENVGVVMFRKEMRFDREFRFLLIKKICAFFITVPLAFALRNYWALVIGMIGSRGIGVLLSYRMHPFRPRFSLAARHDLMHFSKWLVAMNILGFFRERSADLFVGRLVGPRALGILSVSSEISNMPATELVAPINRALLPAYVKLADDKPALGREYLSVMAMITLLAVPAVAGLAATAPYVVLLVLGPNWRDAVPILQVLGFFGIIQVLQSNAYAAFLALGRPQVFVAINAMHVTVLLTTLLLFTNRFGLIGSAWAYVVTALLLLPVNFLMITRYLELKASTLLAACARPLIASTIMYLGLRALGDANIPADMSAGSAAGKLAIFVPTGATLYIGSVALLWWLAGRPVGAESALLDQLSNLLDRTKSAMDRVRRAPSK